MRIFEPDYVFRRVTKITPEFLWERGIKNLLLDVDNTLATQDNPVPAEGVTEWLKLMRDSGINLMIISNNHESRVKPFADLLGLPYSHFSTKPLPRGFVKCMKRLNSTRENTAVVGDQVLTDVAGAHFVGMTAILVLALGERGAFGFKLNRRISKPFIKKCTDRTGGVM